MTDEQRQTILNEFYSKHPEMRTEASYRAYLLSRNPTLPATDADSDYQFRVRAAAAIGEDIDWPNEDEDEDETENWQPDQIYSAGYAYASGYHD